MINQCLSYVGLDVLESCNRVAANQWLVQFQQTDAAWAVATSILTSDFHHSFGSNFEVEFFAAQILKRKIQNEGTYLQPGAKDALLNALLLAAKRFSSGPHQVRAGCFAEIPQGLLPAHPLLNFVFNSLQVPSSFDLAIEVLVELVSRHEGSGHTVPEYKPQEALDLYSRFLAGKPL
ncbi:hypothetical protein ACLB2K_050619 [Fragaria x ananassa]